VSAIAQAIVAGDPAQAAGDHSNNTIHRPIAESDSPPSGAAKAQATDAAVDVRAAAKADNLPVGKVTEVPLAAAAK
jgi:hypothetical protein